MTQTSKMLELLKEYAENYGYYIKASHNAETERARARAEKHALIYKGKQKATAEILANVFNVDGFRIANAILKGYTKGLND